MAFMLRFELTKNISQITIDRTNKINKISESTISNWIGIKTTETNEKEKRNKMKQIN